MSEFYLKSLQHEGEYMEPPDPPKETPKQKLVRRIAELCKNEGISILAGFDIKYALLEPRNKDVYAICDNYIGPVSLDAIRIGAVESHNPI